MTITKLVLLLVCLMSLAVEPKGIPVDAKVTPVFSKDLADIPGKEGLMLFGEYPPGASDLIHRHNAHAFVYVLEGSIVMQGRDGKEVTLTAGQTFYEGPNDVHVVGRNASQTNRARFEVFQVNDKGAHVLVQAHYINVCRACGAAKIQEENAHEHDYCERRYDNLLQGLGRRAGHHVFARLAAQFRCLGQPAPFLRTERFPRGRARPARPWPLQSSLVWERHEWIRRLPGGCD